MAKKLWKILGFPRPKSEASAGKLSLIDNEIYSGILVPNMPLFVRLDGWKFHNLTKELREPFDHNFAKCLVATATKFFLLFNAILAYIFSDEINLLFLRSPIFRVEKIDSIFAGLASTVFSAEFGKRAVFDCRCIPVDKGDIKKYLIWRQAEASRNFNNAIAFHALLKSGMSAKDATKKLLGLNSERLRALAKKHGINPDKTPAWQSRGILLYKQAYEKEGYDPIKKRKVLVIRHKVKEEWNPPLFVTKEGKEFLAEILKRKSI